ncbi:MAG TPA: ankyrin repeat domain-containing protein, partial [Trichocoleus sp.]
EACFNSSSDGLNAAAALTLLKHGADPDPVGSRGFTPLMNAAQSGSAVAVAALLEAGADPSRRNDKGLTAGDIVMAQIGLLGQQQNNPEMTGELRAYYEQGYQDAIACGRLLGLPTDS